MHLAHSAENRSVVTLWSRCGFALVKGCGDKYTSCCGFSAPFLGSVFPRPRSSFTQYVILKYPDVVYKNYTVAHYTLKRCLYTYYSETGTS